MRRIEEAWKSYLTEIVKTESPERIAELRRVFYAGALSCLTIATAAGILNEDHFASIMDDMETELDAYAESLRPPAVSIEVVGYDPPHQRPRCRKENT